MIAEILRRDQGYRRWLAGLPGLWLEVGVFDDTAVLIAMMAERRHLGLPPMSSIRGPRPARGRHRSSRTAAGRAVSAEVRA